MRQTWSAWRTPVLFATAVYLTPRSGTEQLRIWRVWTKAQYKSACAQTPLSHGFGGNELALGKPRYRNGTQTWVQERTWKEPSPRRFEWVPDAAARKNALSQNGMPAEPEESTGGTGHAKAAGQTSVPLFSCCQPDTPRHRDEYFVPRTVYCNPTTPR